ncbi:hypothetical protein [Mariniblastus fucicola]|uniref:Uncharacterized protein n=1 Tax=Mariniblastus fucicola TaxID=980251 RepID=A0A5B9PK47_9BACT|nr:hypothetical protein [Mariniblastus fucicola]QEG25092.1 hypothetical protein MFFC18_50150 [Mariniblastus fucicola]
MKSIYLDRSGLMKNTTFAILSPNGKKKLTRAGRGPFFEYRNARQMAAGMDKIAEQYQVDPESTQNNTQLPFAESVEIGLNISAADVIPIVVLASEDEEQAAALEQKLVPLAWNDDSIIGQFTYAKATRAEDMVTLTGIEGDAAKAHSILIVEPGQFGLSGKVLAQFDSSVSNKDLKTALNDAIMNCKRVTKDHNSHVNLGIKLGIDWESEIPETDPESVAARKRMRGN